MPHTCCVMNCTFQKRRKDIIGLHRIPTNPPERRDRWLIAIKRADPTNPKLPWTPTRSHRVCGKHFITGKPHSSPDHRDYVPSRMMGYKTSHDDDTSFLRRSETRRKVEKAREEATFKRKSQAREAIAWLIQPGTWFTGISNENNAVDHSATFSEEGGSNGGFSVETDVDESSHSVDLQVSVGKMEIVCSKSLENISNNQNKTAKALTSIEGVMSSERHRISENYKQLKSLLSGKSTLSVHAKTGEKLFKCPACEITFPLFCFLDQHMRVHEQLFSCDVCKETFSEVTCLADHMKNHDGEKTFAGEINIAGEKSSENISNSQSNTAKALTSIEGVMYSERHRTSQTPEQLKSLSSEKSFAQKSALTVPIRTGEKPYNCPTCGKPLTSSRHLAHHNIRVHNDQKSFLCHICGKTFGYESSLKTHLRRHSHSLKRFNCPHCDKTFSHWNAVKNHIRTHTGEKPYQCHTCEKSFLKRNYLTLHIRTHTGEKPYKCFVCEKSFSQKSSLNSHKRTHTGETPFKCLVCGSEFSSNSRLAVHKKTHIGE